MVRHREVLWGVVLLQGLLFSSVLSLPLTSPNQSFEVRRLFARGTKADFRFCSSKVVAKGFKYLSSGKLLTALRAQPGDHLAFSPKLWAEDLDFTFGNTWPAPKAFTKFYASEHILEYQLLSSSLGFLGVLHDIPDPMNPHQKFGDKAFTVQGQGTTKIKFCDYMSLYWGQGASDMTLAGINFKDKPISIVSRSIPNNLAFGEELILLDQETNGIKSKMFSPVVKYIREDDTMMGTAGYMTSDATAAKAFFAIKHTLFALDYMLDADVYRLFLKQAQRIADTFDKIEDTLSKNKAYERQEFGDAWRLFVQEHSRQAFSKAFVFVERWAAEFINKYDPQPQPFALSVDQEFHAIFKAIPDSKGAVADDGLIDCDVPDDDDGDDNSGASPSKDGIPPWSETKKESDPAAFVTPERSPQRSPQGGGGGSPSSSDPSSGPESPTRRLQKKPDDAPDRKHQMPPPPRPDPAAAPADQPAVVPDGGGSSSGGDGGSSSTTTKRPLDTSPGKSPGGAPKKKAQFTAEPPSTSIEDTQNRYVVVTPSHSTGSHPVKSAQGGPSPKAMAVALRKHLELGPLRQKEKKVKQSPWYWTKPPLRAQPQTSTHGGKGLSSSGKTTTLPVVGGQAGQSSSTGKNPAQKRPGGRSGGRSGGRRGSSSSSDST